MSQVNNNPFEYSNTNKRYHTYDYYLKNAYGGKCAKITLDCGFSCPNIDGTLGYGGCIYCGNGSSSLNCREIKAPKEQFLKGVQTANKKWSSTVGYIAYMQAYTNTHTSADKLEEVVNEIASYEGVIGIDIATRADCLENEKLFVIDRLSKRLDVTVELGLQSSNDKTAQLINRGHTFAVFVNCISRIRKYAPRVKIGVHIINGLPNESYDDMMKTAKDVAEIHPNFVKIHLLNVLRGTALSKMYEKGEYKPIERDEYIRVVADQLELLPKDIVIERLTADALENELVAPVWARKKTAIINDIDKELLRKNSYQGIKCVDI